MSQHPNAERGSALIEFALAGTPTIFLLLVIFEICLAMWSYHTLAAAINEGAIFASTKGLGCTYTGNSCGVTISAIAQDILTAAPGLDSTRLDLTFHSPGSSDVTCEASDCLSNSKHWPPSTGYIPNLNYIQITGTYPAPVPISSLFWPGKSLAGIQTITFSASSSQVVQF